MPPKGKKQKETPKDERFQAVILTDSFQTRFMPLTAVKPRCLLSLAGVPLIEYTLEFLAKANVNEVFVFCSSHADQIQTYIENSKWVSKTSPFTITTVMSLESRSVGDAMRDLDNRGLIVGDFLLVSGDVVTNIDFEKVMSFHKHKKQIDRDHIVTMVLKPGGPLHRARSHLNPAVFMINKETDKCIYYQSIPPVDAKRSSIDVDPEILEDVEDDMILRNDLIDCSIDICTPHVPQIFQENFDYQTLRSDFLRGVLTSDLLRKSIHVFIAEESYAARVESWASYDAVSQDILGRWCYPIVPDRNLLGQNTYSYEAEHIYKEDKVLLAQSCKIESCTSIGTKTSVGEKSSISSSVIGKNCKIGNNVKITNSYIWDDVIIGNGSVIENSIIAESASVGYRVQIESGCVVGFNVKIGDDKHLTRNSRFIEFPVKKSSSFDDDSFSDDGSASGQETSGLDRLSLSGGSKGFWYSSDDEDEDEDESGFAAPNHYNGIIYQLNSLNLSDESIASISNTKRKRRHSRNRRMSTTSVVSDYDGAVSNEDEDFEKEAIATVNRSLENNHDIDTALLELNTLRMSMNVTYHDVRVATTKSLVSKIVDFIKTGTLQPKEAAEKIIKSWGLLYKRQVFNGEEQADLCQILQETVSHLDVLYNQIILFIAVRVLYELDILEEENIYVWWDSPASTSNDKLKEVRILTGQFVDWLRDAEEESDEDSE